MFEETDTEESSNSLNHVSTLDNDFSKIQFECSSIEEEVTDDDVDLQAWDEIESESDAEFLEDHGIFEEVPATSEDSKINPIHCYRHFIIDEIIRLIVYETNRYAGQNLQIQQLS